MIGRPGCAAGLRAPNRDGWALLLGSEQGWGALEEH